jgi:hypothetical protein
VIKHTPNKTDVGNKPNSILGRGRFEVGEVTVSHAEGLEGAATVGREVHAWIRDYAKGADTAKRGARVLEFDEDEVSILAEYELRNCVPGSFKVDDKDASSGDASYFSFTFTPEDSERY